MPNPVKDEVTSATPACPNMSTCRMYAIFNLTGTLQIWKDNYCTADYGRCARFIGSSEGSAVPDSLLPNGKLLKRAT